MFKIGDYVFDKNNNDRVQVVDVSTVWNFVSYKVFNPVTGAVYKDLTEFIGADTSFDIEAALRSMMAYYESSIGNPVLPIDTYGINDERIIKHLKKEIRQDEHSRLLNISIRDFPNEKGWFMLWHLSVAPDGTGGKTIPVFINENGVLRPLAGKRIWDAILDGQRIISVSEGAAVTAETLDTLTKASQDYAYDVFSDMTLSKRPNLGLLNFGVVQEKKGRQHLNILFCHL